MTQFIQSQGKYGKTLLSALLLSVLVACGGGKTDRSGTTNQGAEGTVVQLSAADSVAARQRDKRRQAAIGTRVTERGFGRDRRYPITNRWKAGV